MRTAAVLVLGVAALLATSCSTQGPVDGEPTIDEAGKSSRPSHSSTASDVPKVTDSIDMSKYKQDPCAALTKSQLEKLSVPVEPQARDGSVGPTCDWQADDETGFSLSGGPVTAGSSLAGSYKRYRQGGFENFKPITVAGYPGYLNRMDSEKATCGAAVAVRNDLLYGISGSVPEGSPYYGKPCVYVKKAAKLATITMSGGS